jgi:hypothetical protein
LSVSTTNGCDPKLYTMCVLSRGLDMPHEVHRNSVIPKTRPAMQLSTGCPGTVEERITPGCASTLPLPPCAFTCCALAASAPIAITTQELLNMVISLIPTT